MRQDPHRRCALLGEHIRVSKEERLKEYDEREREAALGHPLLDSHNVDVF